MVGADPGGVLNTAGLVTRNPRTLTTKSTRKTKSSSRSVLQQRSIDVAMKGHRETYQAYVPDIVRKSRAKPIQSTLKIGTYNVRTLNNYKYEQLIIGCREQELDIIGIQEHRQIFEDEIKHEESEDGSYIIGMSSATAEGNVGVGVLIKAKYKAILSNIMKINE